MNPNLEMPPVRVPEPVSPFKTLNEGPIYQEEFWQGSDRLYIIFGGAFGAFGLTPFDYARSGRILDYSRIFITDPYQAWYQRGVPALGDNVHEVARYLDGRIRASGAREVRFVGNCMGGFAALLFCGLLRKGKAIAFAPQTFLSPERGKDVSDPRGTARLKEMYRHRNEHHIYDLKPWLLQHNPGLQADIHFCADFAPDAPHATELSGLRNVRIHHHAEGGHRVMVYLHKQGLMPAILAA